VGLKAYFEQTEVREKGKETTNLDSKRYVYRMSIELQKSKSSKGAAKPTRIRDQNPRQCDNLHNQVRQVQQPRPIAQKGSIDQANATWRHRKLTNIKPNPAGIQHYHASNPTNPRSQNIEHTRGLNSGARSTLKTAAESPHPPGYTTPI